MASDSGDEEAAPRGRARKVGAGGGGEAGSGSAAGGVGRDVEASTASGSATEGVGPPTDASHETSHTTATVTPVPHTLRPVIDVPTSDAAAVFPGVGIVEPVPHVTAPMSARRPRTVLTLASALLACEVTPGESVAPPDVPSARQPVIEPPSPMVVRAPDPVPGLESMLAPALADWLRDGAVHDDAYARRVLFSWASEKAVARMRLDRELFDDAQLPEGPTAYVQRLEHTASRDDDAGRLAKLLLGHPDLRRRRYAWSRPWATRMGMKRPYGDQVVAVVLKPNAIVARYDPADDPPWRLQDLDARPVPLARVLADPSRLGAVYHVRRDGAPAFREIVLCNEAAIESWSIATPFIDATLREDASAVRRLSETIGAQPPDDYDAARAFAVDHYDPTRDNLLTIAQALEDSIQRDAPLVITPRATFDHEADPATVNVRRLPPKFFEVV